MKKVTAEFIGAPFVGSVNQLGLGDVIPKSLSRTQMQNILTKLSMRDMYGPTKRGVLDGGDF